MDDLSLLADNYAAIVSHGHGGLPVASPDSIIGTPAAPAIAAPQAIPVSPIWVQSGDQLIDISPAPAPAPIPAGLSTGKPWLDAISAMPISGSGYDNREYIDPATNLKYTARNTDAIDGVSQTTGYTEAANIPYQAGQMATAYDLAGDVTATFEVEDPNDPMDKIVMGMILAMAGGAAWSAASGGSFVGPVAEAGGSGAFLGEGIASGVPAWDAAATAAGLELSVPLTSTEVLQSMSTGATQGATPTATTAATATPAGTLTGSPVVSSGGPLIPSTIGGIPTGAIAAPVVSAVVGGATGGGKPRKPKSNPPAPAPAAAAPGAAPGAAPAPAPGSPPAIVAGLVDEPFAGAGAPTWIYLVGLLGLVIFLRS